ncbi:hypothetical protein KSF_075090 [Reticulibacter mediterranei]|uniref:Uncharacterized protein n=1 Tax=Reticulibacter mediterranei TaxID=2778369 RepID=A0A8J3IYB5_9CHLR|nr:hypothetical protein KSF_075090 [Reticulibacter mediterranei]
MRVLLNFLDRSQKMVVEVKDVEKRTEANEFKRACTTRGKGRKIRTKEKR